MVFWFRPKNALLGCVRWPPKIHENWIEAKRYLNMDAMAHQKKEPMRRLDHAA